MPEMPPLVIVPTYEEQGNIIPLVREVMKHVPQVHMLFVDDASQDATREEIAVMEQEFSGKIYLLPRGSKLGLGSAYIAGFHWGLKREYPYLIEMDADFSHHPKYLITMIEKLQVSDGVFGSRYVAEGGTENWSLIRKMISTFGSLYARTILGMSVRDLTGGFNAWSAQVLKTIGIDDVSSRGYAFQIELKYRAWLADFQLEEIPIIFVDRRVGSSKMSYHIILEAMWKVWSLRGLRKGNLLFNRTCSRK
ncbi:MAG: polyprenol monophosphomannose synthase [Oligoflexales bacterium]